MFKAMANKLVKQVQDKASKLDATASRMQADQATKAVAAQESKPVKASGHAVASMAAGVVGWGAEKVAHNPRTALVLVLAVIMLACWGVCVEPLIAWAGDASSYAVAGAVSAMALITGALVQLAQDADAGRGRV